MVWRCIARILEYRDAFSHSNRHGIPPRSQFRCFCAARNVASEVRISREGAKTAAHYACLGVF